MDQRRHHPEEAQKFRRLDQPVVAALTVADGPTAEAIRARQHRERLFGPYQQAPPGGAGFLAPVRPQRGGTVDQLMVKVGGAELECFSHGDGVAIVMLPGGSLT
jgi:hypothetical protein